MPDRHWREACVVGGGHDAGSMVETMSAEEQLGVSGRDAACRLSRGAKRRAESGGRTWLKLRRTGAAVGDAGTGGGAAAGAPLIHGRR